MNLEMARALAQERQRELARSTRRRQAVREARAALSEAPGRRARAWRIPRYHVSWSRTTLSRIGAAGRRERSWVIVISASKGL